MKIEIWCDSGANIHSCRRVTVDLIDTFGFSDEEWAAIPEDEKEDIVKDIAFERLDWGYKEIL